MSNNRDSGLDHLARERLACLEVRAERAEEALEEKLWFVSQAASMNSVKESLVLLRRDAMRNDSVESTVLIEGEQGTEVQSLARVIHLASHRARGPWVVLHCGSYRDEQLDSELFGHGGVSPGDEAGVKRGVLEIAKGGTLFLNGVDRIGSQIQAKLFHALQKGVFQRVGEFTDQKLDIRLIAASSQDLTQAVSLDGFNKGLLEFFSKSKFHIPPLRERSEDIIPFARHLAERAFKVLGKNFVGFKGEVESLLMDYSWPGNVLELAHVLERLALSRSRDGQVTSEEFSVFKLKVSSAYENRPSPPLFAISGEADQEDTLNYTEIKKRWSDSFEKDYLIKLLNKFHGNVSAAARESKLDRSNFLRLLRRHGIRSQVFKQEKVSKAA